MQVERPAAEQGVWRLAAALTGAALVPDVVNAVIEFGPAATGADFANVALLDEDPSRAVLFNGPGIAAEVAERWRTIPVDQTTSLGAALVGRRPVWGGAGRAAGTFPDGVSDREREGIAALVALALLDASGDALGALGLAWRTPQQLDEAARERMTFVAEIVAQAFDRALLHERERKRLSAVDAARAQLLQDAFLPRPLPPTPGLEVAAAYLPASNAPMGGDWYDVFPVSAGTCFVIGDVAGHGLRAASVMAEVRNVIRGFACEHGSPAEVLARTNAVLCRLEPDATASAVVAVWDPAAHSLVRANAGHPVPLRCRADGTEFLVQPPLHPLLGATPNARYENETKVMRTGTTLLFYTDGLIEQRDRSVDEGMAALLGVARSFSDLSPKAVCDAVVRWRTDAGPQMDDMCILAVGIAEGASPPLL